MFRMSDFQREIIIYFSSTVSILYMTFLCCIHVFKNRMLKLQYN